jgi:hypothetical protein
VWILIPASLLEAGAEVIDSQSGKKVGDILDFSTGTYLRFDSW